MNKRAMLSNTELSAFCAQLAMILNSGISAYEGIAIMDSEAETKAEHELLGKVSEKLYETASLYTALAESGVFPEYLLNMVRIGEETGSLDVVMQRLAEHYQREDQLRNAIKTTLRYPAVMAGMMLAVIVILLVKVLPVFNRVYIQLGAEMTGVSRVLMNIGNAISRYSLVFAVICAAALALAAAAVYTEKGKSAAAKIASKAGTVKKLVQLRASMRFAGAMALSLGAGLTPECSLELAAGLDSSEEYAEKIEKCRQSVIETGDFSNAIRDCGIFGGVYAHMAAVGMKTGNVAEVMQSIAELSGEEFETRLNNILASVEPALVIALSLAVGLILLSVMLPLLGIISGL